MILPINYTCYDLELARSRGAVVTFSALRPLKF